MSQFTEKDLSRFYELLDEWKTKQQAKDIMLKEKEGGFIKQTWKTIKKGAIELWQEIVGEVKKLPSKAEALTERAKKRFQTAVDIWTEQGWIKGTFEAGIAWWLATLWTLSDIGGELLISWWKIILPKEAEDLIKSWVKAAAPVIQDIQNKIEAFSASSPEAADIVRKSKLVVEWAPFLGFLKKWTTASTVIEDFLPKTPKKTPSTFNQAQDFIKQQIQNKSSIWKEKLIKQVEKQALFQESRALEQVRQQAEEIATPSLWELSKIQKQTAFEKGNITEVIPETWPFKWLRTKEQIIRTPQEALWIEEVTKLINDNKITKWMSELKQQQVIESEIESLSKQLSADLKTSNASLTNWEMIDFFEELSQKTLESPVITWSSEQVLKKLLPVLKDKLNKDLYYSEDILQLRKDFDKAIREAKGDIVFDPKLENAFTTATRDFRQWLNNKVWELVPEANVRQILDKQNALFAVNKNIADRYARKPEGVFQKAIKEIHTKTWVPKTEIVELATLAWLWTAAFAPIIWPIAWALTAIWAIRVAVKAIKSPANRRKAARILRKIEENLKK